MSEEDQEIIETWRFCPICGHEGNDEICPICNEKTQSLEEEAKKIAQAEDKKSELFDDPQESLESVQEQEEREEEKNDQEDQAI